MNIQEAEQYLKKAIQTAQDLGYEVKRGGFYVPGPDGLCLFGALRAANGKLNKHPRWNAAEQLEQTLSTMRALEDGFDGDEHENPSDWWKLGDKLARELG